MFGILNFIHSYPLLLYYQIAYNNNVALFDGGRYWKLHLLQFGLILNTSLGVLMIAVQMVYRLLSYQVQASLRQFFVDLTQSLWLIVYLIQTLTYPSTSELIYYPMIT